MTLKRIEDLDVSSKTFFAMITDHTQYIDRDYAFSSP